MPTVLLHPPSHPPLRSLVNVQWVLTAAHCINPSLTPASYQAMVHGHSITSSTHECTERIAVANTICHPQAQWSLTEL